MMIIGLVSSYDEGPLLHAAVRSAAAACHLVGVWEGPVGAEKIVREHKQPTLNIPNVIWRYDVNGWKSDAHKRNAMFRWAKQMHTKRPLHMPLWVLWLDGDEVLIWPEYLRDWVARAAKDTAVGGFAIRIVEMDGSVALSHGRVVRGDAIAEYLEGAYQVALTAGQVVALPNTKVCRAGGVPWGPVPMRQLADGTIAVVESDSEEMEIFLARHRPPLAGEPHVLHRSYLRDPARQAARLGAIEQARLDAQAGLPPARKGGRS